MVLISPIYLIFFFFFPNFTSGKETAATPNIQPKFYSSTISYLKFNEARKLCSPSLNILPYANPYGPLIETWYTTHPPLNHTFGTETWDTNRKLQE